MSCFNSVNLVADPGTTSDASSSVVAPFGGTIVDEFLIFRVVLRQAAEIKMYYVEYPST